ncbi:hypothetical protein [Nocardia camponoti]|uniref:Roadblock/LC7 domain-containing protein n=1 Tax=Nocardia camponoti TaxID=1616106 RepID=A0A917VA82_9NOCA|nr:hypothetical protein [Nocardia camponoti]GGK55024.1 hypothetical protein GCM10011591_28670 [Nocardia camponoti]
MNSLDGCLKRIMDIPGACSVTLVDGASGLAIATAGVHDVVDEHENAAGTTEVVRSALTCPALAAGDDGKPTELVVLRPGAFHLLRLIDGDFDGRLFVHVVFDATTGNLGMARYQLNSAVSELTGAAR